MAISLMLPQLSQKSEQTNITKPNKPFTCFNYVIFNRETTKYKDMERRTRLLFPILAYFLAHQWLCASYLPSVISPANEGNNYDPVLLSRGLETVQVRRPAQRQHSKRHNSYQYRVRMEGFKNPPQFQKDPSCVWNKEAVSSPSFVWKLEEVAYMPGIVALAPDGL